MRAIILAAGRGSRLPNYLSRNPKCFIKLRKKSLIDYQIESFNKMGISHLSIVTGYKKNLFKKFKLKTFFNKNWKKTNMVYSLLKADKWLSKYDCLVSYGDIFYAGNKINQLIHSKKPITLLYDPNWKKLWKKRFKDPLKDAETFKIKKNYQIFEIGKKTNKYSNIQGQYMGVIKFRPKGWIYFKKILYEKFDKNSKKMYLTDVFQKIIESNKVLIYGVKYNSKWMEIDNFNDFKILKKNF